MFLRLSPSGREGVMILIRGLSAALFFISLFGWFVGNNDIAVLLCFLGSVGLAVWSSFINLDIELEKHWAEHGHTQP